MLIAEAIRGIRRTLGEVVAEDMVFGKSEINLTAMIDDAEKRRVCNLRMASPQCSTAAQHSFLYPNSAAPAL